MDKISIFKLKEVPNETLGRDLRIIIDGQNLLTLLDRDGSWPEKRQVRLNQDALKDSLSCSGDYPILVCGHCAESGFISPEDVGLKAVKVTVEGEFINWKIYYPVKNGEEGNKTLTVRFHRPQIEREVGKE